MRLPRRKTSEGGFTLAEVAVTLVIVGATLVLVLQGLNSAKITAAHTRNKKLASELARLTVGRVSAGLYQEELDGGGGYLAGSYAEDGYPEFSWEIALGDEQFIDEDDDDYDDGRFDSWTWDDEDEEDDDEATEPFETVKVRVLFPALDDFPNELVLEQWIAWEQVYGASEEEDDR